MLSVSKLLADNYITLEFVGTSCFIKARSTGIILLEGVAKGGLYKVKSSISSSHLQSVTQSVAVNTVTFSQNKFQSLFACLPHSTCEKLSSDSCQGSGKVCLSAVTEKSLDVNLLHRRLGHPNIHTLKTVLNSCKKFADINKTQELELCNACQFGKNHLLHFNSVQITSTAPLQLLYVDL